MVKQHIHQCFIHCSILSLGVQSWQRQRLPKVKVFQAEHEPVEEAGHEEEVQEPLTEQGQEEEFFEPCEDEPDASPGDSAEAVDDDLGNSLSELASVLTVTSNKLRAATLGRKFTGRKSIEERERTSTGSACGAVGHWSGDPECSISSKGGGKKKGKGKPAGGAPSSSGTSQEDLRCDLRG